MDPNKAKAQALHDYAQHIKDSAAYKELMDYEAVKKSYAKQQIAEVLGVNRQQDNSIIATVRILEDALNSESAFKHALQLAMQETIRAVAGVLINERKAEIEAACNFEDLRDVLAAELARQFMASRLTGQPTPFDKPIYGASQNSAGYGAAGVTMTNGTATKVTP